MEPESTLDQCTVKRLIGFHLMAEAAVRRCSLKKCVLKNFAIFTGKHLY